MSVEVKPLGVTCNIQCQYCYQNPQRDAGQAVRGYDVEKMKAAIVSEGGPFSLFGGEVLLLPESDLEALWSWGLERYGRNSLQTNGTLINDNHIQLFKTYKVGVGISADGPDELNDVRWAGTLESTRKATARTHAAIERLCQEGLAPGLIVTLHRGNATRDKLPVMHDWFRYLERLGIRAVRLHVLEVEAPDIRDNYCLSDDDSVAALLSLMELERRELTTLEFDLFREMRNLLLGRDEKTGCVWNACDPYTTRAVRGVEGHGQRSNCSRTNKDGIEFVKSSTEGFERYLALYQTPQEYGGCRDCRFFLMCKGQCPGTAIDGDWRNRTEHCAVWKRLYEHLEKDLLAGGERPLSRSVDRCQLEHRFLRSWESGRNTNMSRLLSMADQTPPPTQARRGQRPALARHGLERLDIELPDFARAAWVSESAREVWGPRLARIIGAWTDVEWLSVAHGIRRCGIVTAGPEAISARVDAWADQGICARPISIGGLHRAVVGAPEDVAAFSLAYDAQEATTISDMLGYPHCCSELFQELLMTEGLSDVTWAIAARSAARRAGDSLVEVGGPYQTNLLWHRTGIRAVPHFPCHSGCEESVRQANSLMEVGRQAGFVDEMNWMKEILSWPVEWTALHGIAEIKTPILKIATRTDATPRKLVVRRRGDSYPGEGSVGLDFPYRQPRGLRLTESTAFRRGLASAGVRTPSPKGE